MGAPVSFAVILLKYKNFRVWLIGRDFLWPSVCADTRMAAQGPDVGRTLMSAVDRCPSAQRAQDQCGPSPVSVQPAS